MAKKASKKIDSSRPKWSGNRPVMFYQEASGQPRGGFVSGDRLRIFYPDGYAEWASLCDDVDRSKNYYCFFSCHPCWGENYSYGKYRWTPKSMGQAISVAARYDKSMGFEPMEFICEL